MTTTETTALRIEEVAYHRNGVAGIGFHAVAFTCPEHGPMLATVFPGRGRVAVYHRGLLAKGLMGGSAADDDTRNAWRGDRYEDELRAAVRAWEKARASA